MKGFEMNRVSFGNHNEHIDHFKKWKRQKLKLS